MKKNWLLIVLVLALGLAACGDDDSDNGDPVTPTVAATEVSGGAFNPGAAPDLSLNLGGSGLPGCNDPDDTACPSPLEFPLDADVSNGGISIQYSSRYFDAQTEGTTDGVPIEISPSGNYKFEEQATFLVYFAPSVEDALASLQEPETGTWENATLSGTVGVVKDDTQDPPVNTTIGAFTVPDGRVVVLKLVTTGKYGWDLLSLTYENMLNTLTVEPDQQAG